MSASLMLTAALQAHPVVQTRIWNAKPAAGLSHPNTNTNTNTNTNPYIQEPIAWLERAVIGLNHCPFAKAEHVLGKIHDQVSNATDAPLLMQEFERSVRFLIEQPTEKVETMLLIHPEAMQDFLAYSGFLGDAEDLLFDFELEGVLQVASFYPAYQFAGTQISDRENYTNRSPYPMLHLLREESVSRAVDSLDDPDSVFERNIATLKNLDEERWQKIFRNQQAPKNTD